MIVDDSRLRVKVTSFFQEAEAFKVLEERIIPFMLKKRTGHLPVRVWVPGCASGEEAFSRASGPHQAPPRRMEHQGDDAQLILLALGGYCRQGLNGSCPPEPLRGIL